MSIKVVCRVGEHQHWLAHQRSPCEQFCIHKQCEVKHTRDTGMEHLWVNGWSIYGLKLVGQLWLKCVAQLCLFWKYAQKVLVFRGVPFLVIA